ncbi:MAG: NAD(P)H-hydrate dehydratase [Gemmatimonadaceae bacterium]|nr:NAD(P)H-hydrate dehydratase [Gemmatimonadaceae bacterium]
MRVTKAAEAAAMDRRANEAGTASWSLMEAAGRGAATVIRERFRARLEGEVVVLAGGGNNGGDGYVVASELAAAGARVTVVATAPPGTDDSRRARAELPAAVRVQAWADGASALQRASLVIDAMLGTGAAGAPRAEVGEAIAAVARARGAGASVAALDVPSGVNATTGEVPGGLLSPASDIAQDGSSAGVAPAASVTADITVAFGTVKRGLLRNRDAAGEIVVVDIGLGAAAHDQTIPRLVDATYALSAVPPIAAGANKGTRRKLLIVGGAAGMAGAPILAARGALRSGIGMVRVCVEPPSIVPVQAAEPSALVVPWPVDDAALADYLGWTHAVLLGPGLGPGRAERELAARVLSEWKGPVVVDADALNAFEGRAAELGRLLRGRPAVITPHPVEAQRLTGRSAGEIDAARFDSAREIAKQVNATVLLKGVPTVISDGAHTLIVASGTPVLATGGSGDMLGGIVATLLAQTGDATASAAAGAWVHGRAAELAGAGQVRGVTLDDVLASLREAWRAPPQPRLPVLTELPCPGGAR